MIKMNIKDKLKQDGPIKKDTFKEAQVCPYYEFALAVSVGDLVIGVYRRKEDIP